MNKFKVKIVGAGLAGSECALVLSRFNNFSIDLIEMRPKNPTEVHKTPDCAELVCSNSLKSLKYNSAAGMLKYELAALASPLLECAFNTKVDAGNALAVDRIQFSKLANSKIEQAENINYIVDEADNISRLLKDCDYLVLATGPLTSQKLSDSLIEYTGQGELAFYDAAAPIVETESLDMDKIFSQDRYNSEGSGDYLNISLDQDQYKTFISQLLDAKCVIKKNFESKDLFQACQPIEEVARSGFDAPRFGTMKPIGISDPKTGKRPYAVVQLRAENANKTAYNLVGFQTNLTFGEQKRIFSMLPGLENADFSRYGVMHRNTFINSPHLLNSKLQLNTNTNIFIAGQLSGTEGYVEAIRSGHHVALCCASACLNQPIPVLPETCAFGALLIYATNPDTKKYQPMHVNFGIMPPLEKRIKSKQDRYFAFAKRGEQAMNEYMSKLAEQGLFRDKATSLKLISALNDL